MIIPMTLTNTYFPKLGGKNDSYYQSAKNIQPISDRHNHALNSSSAKLHKSFKNIYRNSNSLPVGGIKLVHM